MKLIRAVTMWRRCSITTITRLGLSFTLSPGTLAATEIHKYERAGFIHIVPSFVLREPQKRHTNETETTETWQRNGRSFLTSLNSIHWVKQSHIIFWDGLFHGWRLSQQSLNWYQYEKKISSIALLKSESVLVIVFVLLYYVVNQSKKIPATILHHCLSCTQGRRR